MSVWFDARVGRYNIISVTCMKHQKTRCFPLPLSTSRYLHLNRVMKLMGMEGFYMDSQHSSSNSLLNPTSVPGSYRPRATLDLRTES